MTFHQQSLTLDESLNVPKLFLTELEWIYASSKSLVFHACTNILKKGVWNANTYSTDVNSFEYFFCWSASLIL